MQKNSFKEILIGILVLAFLMFGCVVSAVAAPGDIMTVAGTGVRGFSGDGGQATQAMLTSFGVFVDTKGDLFIADVGNFRIRKVDTNGIITTVAGTGIPGFSGDGGQATKAMLSFPKGVFVDTKGDLFIADGDNYRIRKVDTNGIITTVAGTGAFRFSGDGGQATQAMLTSFGVFVDTKGDLFIADLFNQRIRKVDTNGIITTVAGTGIPGFSGDGGQATKAMLNNPNGVFVDTKGDLFIADRDNHRIRRVEGIAAPTTLGGVAALPAAAADTTPPKVTASSPKNGDKDIDPAKVTKITVEFDEPVTVSGVKLAARGGDVLQIKVEVKEKVLEVTFLGGAKLAAGEITYDLTGKAKDAAGNESDFKISFTTKKVIPPGVYVLDDKEKVTKDGFIVSWLWLEPTIETNAGSVQAKREDYFKDIPNKLGKKGEANLIPVEGEKATLSIDKREHAWVRVNFLDLVAMGEIIAAVGGNELDLKRWGGMAKDAEGQYLVTHLKWNADQEVTFRLGSDDSSESYFNGELLTDTPVDQNWQDGNAGTKKVKVKGGQWNVLVVGVYESGGEWGISVNVNPKPDEIDNSGKLLPAEVVVPTPVATAAVFAVGGVISRPDGTPAPDGLEVVVTNKNTNKTQKTSTGGIAGKGGYQATFVDTDTNRAAAVDDEITITVIEKGKTVATTTHKVTADDIKNAKADINLTLKPIEVVEIVSRPKAGFIVVSGPDAAGNITIRGARGAVIGRGLIKCIYRDGSIATARANADGSFFLAVAASVAGEGFELTITDAEGRESAPTRISTRVRQIPAGQITVSPPDPTGKVTISGRAGSVPGNSLLYCIYADGTVITARANADGSFILTADVNIVGAAFDLIATDEEGNILSAGRIRTGASQTGTFYVTGTVRNRDGSIARNDLQMKISNLKTGASLTDLTGRTAGNGQYSARLEDRVTNRAAAVNDTIEITVLIGNEVVGRQQMTLTQRNIEDFSLVIDVTIEKTTFTLQLSAGINLISLPLNPQKSWKMSDLAQFIGPEVETIIYFRHEPKSALSSYSPADVPDSIYNAKVEGNEALIVVMKAPKKVTFTGAAWSEEVSLRSGRNFIGVPLDPEAPWTLKELVNFVGPNFHQITVYDRYFGNFVDYNETLIEKLPAIRIRKLLIKGGEGYILSALRPTQLKFKGKAWENIPSETETIAAPLLANLADKSPLVILEGKILRGDDGTALKLKALELIVHNITAGWKLKNEGQNVEDGYYRLTHVDFENNRAIRVGDLVALTIVDPTNAFGKEVVRYVVTSEDIKQGRIRLKDAVLFPIPKESALLPNYPNPFNPETWLPYQLSEDSDVVIRIYNISGQLVRTLSLGRKDAGVHVSRSKAAYWDGRNDAGEMVSSGLYFYSLHTGKFQATRKMILVK